jgi:hypothetical protein
MITTTSLQNTGQEFDGSDSGARPDEAVSWGKIRAGAETVKVGWFDVRYRPKLIGSRCSPMQRWYFLCSWRQRLPKQIGRRKLPNRTMPKR